MRSWLFILIVIPPCMVFGKSKVEVIDLYWNSSSDMVHTLSQYYGSPGVLSVKLRDRLNIHCPYSPSYSTGQTAPEVFQIYSVSEYEYKHCFVDDSTAKLVGVCNAPQKASIITVVFRDFTPRPGGIDYVPGRTYYFITTSSGNADGLAQRKGGLCERHNMRLKISIDKTYRSDHHTAAEDVDFTAHEYNKLKLPESWSQNNNNNNNQFPSTNQFQNQLSSDQYPQPQQNQNHRWHESLFKEPVRVNVDFNKLLPPPHSSEDYQSLGFQQRDRPLADSGLATRSSSNFRSSSRSGSGYNSDQFVPSAAEPQLVLYSVEEASDYDAHHSGAQWSKCSGAVFAYQLLAAWVVLLLSSSALSCCSLW